MAEYRVFHCDCGKIWHVETHSDNDIIRILTKKWMLEKDSS